MELRRDVYLIYTELLQNVVDHAFPADCSAPGGPHVTISFRIDEPDLVVTVTDNGVGPPVDFDFAEASGLGLTLVQTFVTTELGGRIEMGRGPGSPGARGTTTVIRFPRTREDRVQGPLVGT